MTTVQLSGIASGLDTGALVDAMVTEYSVPQARLKTRVAADQSQIASLQALNSALQKLETSGANLGGTGALNDFSTTASDPSVTAVADSSALAGSLSFTVDRVATAQSSVTAAIGSWSNASGAITLVAADGTTSEITAASDSLADVAHAINTADAGVSATLVAAGEDGNGTALYRIQLTSTETGAASAFSLYAGTAAEVTAGTASDVLAAPGAATVTTAQDAQITLWGGTAAQQTMTSTSNTFDELMSGVDVTVSAVTTAPVTISVAPDNAASTKDAQTLISSLGSILSFISANSSPSTSTDGDGKTTTKLGAFTGDPTIRQLNRSLLDAASNPVDGKSPSSIGVTITRDGTITFDADKFGEALENDPDGTRAMFATIASRLADVATTASDPYTGALTGRITSEKTEVTNLNTEIADWDSKISNYKAMIQSQFTAMETAISTLNTQLRFLQMQMASLNGSAAGTGTGSGSGAAAASAAK